MYGGKLTDDDLRRILEKGEIWGLSGWRGAKYGRFKLVEFEKMHDEPKVVKLKKAK